MNKEELEKKVEELEKRASEIEKAEIEKREAKEKEEKRKDNFYKENLKMDNTEKRNIISKAFVEKRDAEGLKLSDTGVDFYGSMVEKFRIEKTLTGKVAYLRGSYTGFKVTLIKSRPAVQASQTEGDTALTKDSQMAIGNKTVTPELFYSILPITYQTEKFSQITDAEITDAFAEAFGESIEIAMQSRNAGSSYAISGVLSADSSVVDAANRIEAKAPASLTWADLYALAGKAKGKIGSWTIVVPSESMGTLLSAEGDGSSFMKEEYSRTGAIRGVPVVEIAVDPVYTEGATLATLNDLTFIIVEPQTCNFIRLILALYNNQIFPCIHGIYLQIQYAIIDNICSHDNTTYLNKQFVTFSSILPANYYDSFITSFSCAIYTLSNVELASFKYRSFLCSGQVCVSSSFLTFAAFAIIAASFASK